VAERKPILAVNKEQAERIKDYYATFSTAEGKRVLEDLKKEYLRRDSYVKGDIWETFRRTVCRDLIAGIEYMIYLADEQIEVEEDDGGT